MDHLKERAEGLLAGMHDSSDVKHRYLKHPGEPPFACILYIDGIVNTASIQEHIIEPLLNKPDAPSFSSVLEVPEIVNVNESTCIERLLNGATIILLNGYKDIIAADTAKWQDRTITNPKGQRTIEGPDIGFTESLNTNVALLRKYIKNPSLHVETETYGQHTGTSVSLVYLENMVDPDILQNIKRKLADISIDSIIGSNYIAEYLTKESKTIFPLVLNSDRPDVAAAEVIEGRVCIIVDGTPFVLIAPAVFIQFFQSADDYYINSAASGLVRPFRFLFFWISLYIPSLYVAFTTFHKGLLPVNLLVGFLAQREAVPFPTVFEVLLVLFLTEAIFEASSRLPQSVVITISLFGAIVFGQASVEAQLVQPITLVIISSSFILSSIIPIAAMGYATRIIKLSLISVGALLGLYGIALYTLILLVHLCYLRSFNVPYLAPIAPFTKQDMAKDVFFRKPIPDMNKTVPVFHKEESLEEQPDKEKKS